jgi:type IV pilus assembly protein PilE|nr:type IV pilin protein [uncultured Albidiferax sp.]
MHTMKNNGFTLIELMIVVAVIAILAAVAYPAYTESIVKGKRAQGRTALAELMQQQERYMTQRNCYLGFTGTTATPTPTAPSPSTACGGVTATSVPFKNFSGDSFATRAYTLTADVCPTESGTNTLSIAECVRVLATPVKADAAVDVLWMTSTGSKGCTGTAKTSNPALCWP